MLTPEEQEIVDRYKHPQFSGELAHPTCAGDGHNASCGDEVRIETIVKDGVIQEVRHQTRGCAICTAAADLLAEHIQGKKQEEIQSFSAEEMLGLMPIQVSATRSKCALLPLEALKEANDLPQEPVSANI